MYKTLKAMQDIWGAESSQLLINHPTGIIFYMLYPKFTVAAAKSRSHFLIKFFSLYKKQKNTSYQYTVMLAVFISKTNKVKLSVDHNTWLMMSYPVRQVTLRQWWWHQTAPHHAADVSLIVSSWMLILELQLEIERSQLIKVSINPSSTAKNLRDDNQTVIRLLYEHVSPLYTLHDSLIGQVNECPTMHRFRIPRHTQSTRA